MRPDPHALLERAWLDAAVDRGIAVEQAGSLALAEADVPYAARIRDFGGPDGCVVAPLASDVDAPLAAADAARVTGSALSGSYTAYDRRLFVETLGDWGRHGEGEPPAWYSGTPWTR